MILTVPLYPGTLLANVRYRWIANGVTGSDLSAGITQPDPTWPEFRFDVSPPDGAEEMIAFDVTNTANWNPAGYLKKAAAEVVPAPAEVRMPFARTVTFRSVLDAITRRHGLEPDWADSPGNRARAITEHINERVNTAWVFWDWPETLVLEERAFRPTWDTLVAYSAGAEVYYPPDMTYHRAIGGTTPGQAPTDLTAWEAISITDAFIPLDAPGQTSIGTVFGVYSTNPREIACYSAPAEPFKLLYRVSQEGIDIGCGHGGTVWIHFQIAPPEFSAVPYATGHSYKKGDVRYFPATEECYKAMVDTTNDPTTADWQIQSMPAFLAAYVKEGAYGDGLRESDPDQKDPVMLQIRNTKVAMAEQKADGFITSEADRLIAQGEIHYHGIRFGSNYWRCCPPRVVYISVTA